MTASRVLVYGGRGALGATCVNYFKSNNWESCPEFLLSPKSYVMYNEIASWVGSIDLFPNEEAQCNITIEVSESWTNQEQEVCTKVEESLKGEKVDAILCVAGGWAGGSAASKSFIKNSDLMWKQSVWTSAIAAHLASKHLKENGVLVLTGAHPALQGTPGMIGYGMAKAAVHQLVKSLGADKSGLPQGSFVSAILPVTLDTPMNRKNMPNADFGTWTPLETVARLLHGWTQGEDRPPNGSLVQLFTEEGKTKFVPVDA